MKSKHTNPERRQILKMASLAVASTVIGIRAGASDAQAAMPHLQESDPLAKSLGYRGDARKVDRKKYASYVPGSKCANCNLFQGKHGAAWGPCPIYAGKEVSANGWCTAYVKKT